MDQEIKPGNEAMIRELGRGEISDGVVFVTSMIQLTPGF